MFVFGLVGLSFLPMSSIHMPSGSRAKASVKQPSFHGGMAGVAPAFSSFL